MKWPKAVAAIGAALAGICWFVVWVVREQAGDPLVQGARAYGRADWSSAETRARSVLKTNSSDPHALRLFARASARQGREESAEAIYRRLGTKFMKAEDFFLLGRGLLATGQVGPALASLGAARDLEPDHAETLDALSQYWAQSGSMSDAVDAAERLRKQPGWQVRGDVRLGRLLAQLFDPAGAASVLADALRRDPLLIKPIWRLRRLAGSWHARGFKPDSRLWRAPHSMMPPPWVTGSTRKDGGSKVARTSRNPDSPTRNPPSKRPMNSAVPIHLSANPPRFLGRKVAPPATAPCSSHNNRSRHSRTLQNTAHLQDLPWPTSNINDPNNSRVNHQFHRADSTIEVVTEVGNEAFRAVVEFAMGSNHHGQSFLAREENGQIRELRIARYPVAPEWDRTMEHPLEPPDEHGYLGRPITAEAFRKCINCHSTNFRAVFEPNGRPEARDHGIGCERCHGPAGNHPAAIAAAFPQPAIARPRLAPAARIVALCGECHTAPTKTTREDPSFVRYQASSLVLSRCYTESHDRLSCVNCHDPHQDVETAAAPYEATCLHCHTLSRSSARGQTGQQFDRDKAEMARTVCPVNPRNDCLTCHMPKIKNAVPRTVFTDHHIRVRRQ